MNLKTRSVACLASVLVAGVAVAQSTQAVEWKVSEGGNGHWYQQIDLGSFIGWNAARDQSLAKGGHLVTLTSASENAWVWTVVRHPYGEWDGWIGWYQNRSAADYSEPSGGWRWVTGESVSFVNWAPPYQPDDFYGLHEDFGNFQGPGTWNDVAEDGSYGGSRYIKSFFVEWEADCNADGIIDYGQILRGELEDLNANGVPDICETSITSVLPPSVPAQGGSTITIRGNGFPTNPTVLIGGVPATNVVRESLTRITVTSPAVTPGMKSVSVNGFTLPDGIYIRPECGSDLDQNGFVDAADIGIILLDFGQCYETPLAAPSSSEVPELLEAQPEVPRKR